MPINFKDLHYALALERRRNFSRAAEECGVSQPTLSAQIRKLEDELGLELFERDGRTIRVTPAGETILDQARIAVEAARRIEEVAASRADPMVGPLRIGVIPTLAPYLLPEVLPLVPSALPDAPLVVVEDLTHRLIEALQSGKLDAALLATSHPAERFSEIALFDEPFSLAVPTHDRLAKLARVPVDRLDPTQLILLNDGHCLADQARAFCGESRGAALHSDLSATSLETVLNLVDAGLGMTIVPELARLHLHRRFANVAFRPLSGEDSSRTIRLVHRAFMPRRNALVELARVILTATPFGSDRKTG